MFAALRLPSYVAMGGASKANNLGRLREEQQTRYLGLITSIIREFALKICPAMPKSLLLG